MSGDAFDGPRLHQQQHTSWLSAVSYGLEDDEDEGSCASCSPPCQIFVRHGLLVLLSVLLYAACLVADAWTAVEDYREDSYIYCYVTGGLVLLPSLLFSLYMFCTCLMTYGDRLAHCRAVLWLVLVPVLPFWPIVRGAMHIYHALAAAACRRKNLPHHLNNLEKPTSAHLLQFLHAFTTAAPQLLLRLYKITDRIDSKPIQFSDIRVDEWNVMCCSLLVMSTALVTTINKSANTRELLEGKLALHNLTCCRILLTLVGWWSFLSARLTSFALFTHEFLYWTAVLALLHCLLVFALQKKRRKQHPLRTVFVYLFSSYLFIFAYVLVNMKSRIKSSWASYLVFAVLAFVEQSSMLALWTLNRQKIITNIPFIPVSNTTVNCSFKNEIVSGDPSYFAILPCYDYDVILMHTVVYVFSLMVMALVLCCAIRSSDDDVFKKSEEKTCCCC